MMTISLLTAAKLKTLLLALPNTLTHALPVANETRGRITTGTAMLGFSIIHRPKVMRTVTFVSVCQRPVLVLMNMMS